MEEKIKELENELLNKTMTLLEMDNICQKIIETQESIYEYLNDSLEQHSFGYITGYSDELGEEAIIIDFEILDNNYEEKLQNDDEYKFNMLIKINTIYKN